MCSSRGLMWFEGCGAKEIVDSDVYDRLLSMIDDELDLSEKFGNVFEIIDKDIPRSFGTVLQMYDSESLRKDLRKLLMLFCVHCEDIGYTQGMNFIGVLLLAHLNLEYAFWMLVHISRSLPASFYAHAAQDELMLFAEIVSNYAPVIKQQMILTSSTEHDINNYRVCIGYLLIQWMVPLFLHAVPLVTTLDLWDFLFNVDGDLEATLILNLHRIAFSILEIHAGILLSKYKQISKAIEDHYQAREIYKQRKFRKESQASAFKSKVKKDPDYINRLLASQDQLLGYELIKRVLLAASKDRNSTRIVHLAKEVTIKAEWLQKAREEQIAEKYRIQSHEILMVSEIDRQVSDGSQDENEISEVPSVAESPLIVENESDSDSSCRIT